MTARHSHCCKHFQLLERKKSQLPKETSFLLFFLLFLLYDYKTMRWLMWFQNMINLANVYRWKLVHYACNLHSPTHSFIFIPNKAGSMRRIMWIESLESTQGTLQCGSLFIYQLIPASWFHRLRWGRAGRKTCQESPSLRWKDVAHSEHAGTSHCPAHTIRTCWGSFLHWYLYNFFLTF